MPSSSPSQSPSSARTAIASASVRPSSSTRRVDLVDVLPHVTDRDRALLALLAEHLVLTTPQVTAALFGSPRACQQRLRVLHRLELVDRITWRRDRATGGSKPAHWALGRLGLDHQAGANQTRPTSVPAARAWLARVAKRPDLAHLLGVNDFFTTLLAQACRRRGRALARWWSEPTTARLFPGVFPDGHGLWHEHGTVTGFFLEYDTGTEELARLVGKLAAYERLAADHGPRYPVLISLHSSEREINLHNELRRLNLRVPVATTARPTPDPAGPVWLPAGHAETERVRLSELDSYHGPDHPRNPNWVDGRLATDIAAAVT